MMINHVGVTVYEATLKRARRKHGIKHHKSIMRPCLTDNDVVERFNAKFSYIKAQSTHSPS